MPKVTLIYAGLLGVMLVGLTLHVIRHRGRTGIGLGDGGDPLLARAIRAHANFIEYVPIALVTMTLLELAMAPAVLLHGLGVSLLVGRIVHAWALHRSAGASTPRAVGVGLTFLAILVGAVAALYYGTRT